MNLRTKLSDDSGIMLFRFVIAGFMFFLPLSPSAKSLFFGFALAILLIFPYFSQQISRNFKTFWGMAALALFLFILISSIWSSAPFAARLSIIEKYGKLLCLPVFAAGFSNAKTRIWTLNSYLMAVSLTCLVSFLKYMGFIPGYDAGELFYNHIVTGFMVAFGGYVAMNLALKTQGAMRYVYVVIAIITSLQVLFINTGRTGYFIFALLMGILIFSSLGFKKGLLGGVFISALFFLSYFLSSSMQLGLKSLVYDVKVLKNNANTSLGYRMQFHDYAKSLYVQHPLIGVGAAGFKNQFYADDPIPSWGRVLTDPHSQYWMILSEQGTIGIGLLLGYLFSLYLLARQLTETRLILMGILAAFSIYSLSDTVLAYSTVGYIFVIMSAIGFGELLEKRRIRHNLDFIT